MSWCDRRRVMLGLAAAPLAACGFRPAYGPGGAAAGLQGQVRLAAPEDREAFDLTGRLEERLGRAGGAARYRLAYDISTDEESIAVTPAQEITRYHVAGTVRYTLTDTADDSTAASGRVESFTAYPATGTPVAARAAERDARARLMTILADRLVTRLIAEVAPR